MSYTTTGIPSDEQYATEVSNTIPPLSLHKALPVIPLSYIFTNTLYPFYCCSQTNISLLIHLVNMVTKSNDKVLQIEVFIETGLRIV